MRKSRHRDAAKRLVEGIESVHAGHGAGIPDLTPIFGRLIESIAQVVVDRIARDLLSLPVHTSSERRRRE